MYEQQYGLNRRPFGAAAEGSDVFVGPQTARIMQALRKALATHDAAAVITGAPGVGKTTAVRRSIDALEGTTFIVRIGRMQLAHDEILEFLLEEFGADSIPASTIKRINLFRELLKDKNAGGVRSCILVEDAVRIGEDALVELEALTAADGDECDGANLILMGGPELKEQLRENGLARLHQRVRLYHSVEPFVPAELLGYLRHCFRLAGGDFDAIFDNKCVTVLHSLTDGIPRLANNIVESSLNAGADRTLARIDADVVAAVAESEYGLNAEIPADHAGTSAVADDAQEAAPADPQQGVSAPADTEVTESPDPSPAHPPVNDTLPDLEALKSEFEARAPAAPERDADDIPTLFDSSRIERQLVVEDSADHVGTDAAAEDTDPAPVPGTSAGQAAPPRAAASPAEANAGIAPTLVPEPPAAEALSDTAPAAETTTPTVEATDGIAPAAETTTPTVEATDGIAPAAETATPTVEATDGIAPAAETATPTVEATDGIAPAAETTTPPLEVADSITPTLEPDFPAADATKGSAPSLEPETPAAEVGDAISPASAPEPTPADSAAESIPDYDRDPTLAELRPDLDALEEAMAELAEPDIEGTLAGPGAEAVPDAAPVEQVSEAPPTTPELEFDEGTKPELPQITLDQSIREKIEEAESATSDSATAVDGEADPAAGNGTLEAPANTCLKSTTELRHIATGLSKAESIEDIDEAMAETLFGTNINTIAARVLELGPDQEPANENTAEQSANTADEFSLSLEETAPASPAADANPAPTLSLADEPEDAPDAEKSELEKEFMDVYGEDALEVSLETDAPAPGMDLSASQRLATVRALNADRDAAAPRPIPGQPAGGESPAPIEDQIQTSMTQTLAALNVRQTQVADDDGDDDDDETGNRKRGFFSRFRRS